MKDSLKPGLNVRFTFTVPEDKTVRHLLPEAPEFQVMPRVLATGFMVGLMEWACIQAVNPHINWPTEQTVGIGVNVSHSAATPPGLTVTIEGKLEKVEGRKLVFSLSAHDGIDTISEGTHERYVIDGERLATTSWKSYGGPRPERNFEMGRGMARPEPYRYEMPRTSFLTPNRWVNRKYP